jgi:hypothetical protein
VIVLSLIRQALQGTPLVHRIPPLPGKGNRILQDQRDPAFISARRVALEEYMQAVVSLLNGGLGYFSTASRQGCGRRDTYLGLVSYSFVTWSTAGKEQYAEILKIVLNYLDLEPLRMSHDDGEDVHQSIVESKA